MTSLAPTDRPTAPPLSAADAILADMPEWEPDVTIEPPTWMVEGARVLHSTFGSGTIGRVGHYKDVPTVWIDFDDGQTKGLALEFGLPHLSPQTTPDQPKRRQCFRRGHR